MPIHDLSTLSSYNYENLLHNLLETIPDRVWLKDLNGIHLACNSAFAALVGARPEDVIGTDDAHWFGEQAAHDFRQTDLLTLQAGKTTTFEGPMPSPLHDDPTTYEVTKTPMRDANGRIIGVLGMGRNIQERKNAEALLHATQAELQATLHSIKHLAHHDPLTGLPNRRMLANRMETALAASQRYQTHGAVLFVDLDKFKQLNDNHGHDVGDLLLQEVARRLQRCVRAVDTVARLGGDEFVVLIQELSADAHDAHLHSANLGHKILASLAEPYSLQGEVHSITPSIGATLFLGQDVTASELLRHADMAMFEAKAAGRNTLCFHDKIGL